MIPPPHTYNSSQSTLCLHVQILFALVGSLYRNVGLTPVDILGAYTVGESDMRGNSLYPLFPPFRSGTNLPPICGHILPASHCPVSPDTTSSCAKTVSAAGSGVGGPSAQTPASEHQSGDCAGSGLVRFRR